MCHILLEVYWIKILPCLYKRDRSLEKCPRGKCNMKNELVAVVIETLSWPFCKDLKFSLGLQNLSVFFFSVSRVWCLSLCTEQQGNGAVKPQTQCLIQAPCLPETVYYYGFLILTSSLWVMVSFYCSHSELLSSFIMVSSPHRYSFLGRSLICLFLSWLFPLKLPLSHTCTRSHVKTH